MHALEEKARSMSLTMVGITLLLFVHLVDAYSLLNQADLKVLEEKSDVEKAIADLETGSRGWFEAEEDFLAMCKAEEKEAKQKYAAKMKAKQAQQQKKGTYAIAI